MFLPECAKMYWEVDGNVWKMGGGAKKAQNGPP